MQDFDVRSVRFLCDIFLRKSVIYTHWFVKNKGYAHKRDIKYQIYVCKKFKYKTYTLLSIFQIFIYYHENCVGC